MDDYGTVLESGAVRFERVLPGPIERVWDYLTDSDKRGRWLAGGPMELRPGGRAELRFRHADLTSVQEPTPDKYKAMENGVKGEIIKVRNLDSRKIFSAQVIDESSARVVF